MECVGHLFGEREVQVDESPPERHARSLVIARGLVKLFPRDDALFKKDLPRGSPGLFLFAARLLQLALGDPPGIGQDVAEARGAAPRKRRLVLEHPPHPPPRHLGKQYLPQREPGPSLLLHGAFELLGADEAGLAQDLRELLVVEFHLGHVSPPRSLDCRSTPWLSGRNHLGSF